MIIWYDVELFLFFRGRQHRREPSIPKFGAWDETDPRLGESLTVIFNKVKRKSTTHPPSSRSCPPSRLPTRAIRKKQESSSSSRSKVSEYIQRFCPLVHVPFFISFSHRLMIFNWECSCRYVAACVLEGGSDSKKLHVCISAFRLRHISYF